MRSVAQRRVKPQNYRGQDLERVQRRGCWQRAGAKAVCRFRRVSVNFSEASFGESGGEEGERRNMVLLKRSRKIFQ